MESRSKLDGTLDDSTHRIPASVNWPNHFFDRNLVSLTALRQGFLEHITIPKFLPQGLKLWGV